MVFKSHQHNNIYYHGNGRKHKGQNIIYVLLFMYFIAIVSSLLFREHIFASPTINTYQQKNKRESNVSNH